MGLNRYQAKRNFERTTEPAGKESRSRMKGRDPLFVVQKHAARRLHYDFRLEMEGVLKSWAVPRGFPMRKGEGRLAVQVEDHPLDYADFEGNIAAGNYGAGTVMVWDRGVYQVRNGEPLEALKAGKIQLTLAGEKLKGDWTLVRMRGSGKDEKAQWLLLKSGRNSPPISARAENKSVLTQRTLEDIAAAESPDRKGKRSAQTSRAVAAPKGRAPKPKLPANTRALPKAKPGFIPPMKCELVRKLPEGREWIYEIKFDGVRALPIKSERKLALMSRNAKELGAKYPEVAEALAKLPCREAVLDGEIVAIDAQGRSSFQMLQAYNMVGRAKPVILYYAFDLLNLEGRDLTGLPLVKRKEMLKALLASGPESIRFSANIEADSPARVVKEMKARGLEGLVA
ncbi:MAG: polymerase LigD, ligase domain protein, partial [Pedosphaera sp.]|nr:polymerase LigD, ligase domain protein [Pedosphaera sp.]